MNVRDKEKFAAWLCKDFLYLNSEDLTQQLWQNERTEEQKRLISMMSSKDHIIRQYWVNFHCNADETQLNLSLHPD